MVNGCFVIGLDGHGPDIFDQVFSFVKEVELYEVQITVLTPFPGTPLYARLEQENRLIEPRNWRKCTLFDINFQPANMSVEELHDRFKRLAVAWRIPWKWRGSVHAIRRPLSWSRASSSSLPRS